MNKPVIHNSEDIKSAIISKQDEESLRRIYTQPPHNIHSASHWWYEYKYYILGTIGIITIGATCYYFDLSISSLLPSLFFFRNQDDGPGNGGPGVILSDQRRSNDPAEILRDIEISDNRSDSTVGPSTPTPSTSLLGGFQVPKSGFEEAFDSQARAQGLEGVFVLPKDEAHEALLREESANMSEASDSIQAAAKRVLSGKSKA